ncbi:hypothetical protein FQR65_LT16678 [Abscondita terminalis]|nr:hypothetical protein FQR65_LT16678 [Abscondita terminalis]
MKDNLVKYLKQNQKTHKNILLKEFPQSDKIIDDLCEENIIKQSYDQVVYYLGDKYFFGSIRISQKGFGFIKNLIDENIEDTFVPPTSLNNSLSNDEVIYVLEKEEDGRTKGEVIEIINREKEFLIGEIVESKDKKFLDFVASDSNFKNYRTVMVNKKSFSLKKDLLVKVKILEVKDRKIFLKIVKIIGDANKAIDRITSIAYEFDINPEFNKATIENAEIVAKPINYSDKEVSRRKKIIKDKCLVTIDGADSKDLDDAICVEKRDNGDYVLIVAIADVSHYVQPRSPLDNTALYRGNSVYLANKVIPMLPKVLSNGVCSLNPNEDKLCMVSEILFSKTGRVLNVEIYESIMNSKARLTYSEVNEFYETKTSSRNSLIQEMLLYAKELHEIIESLKDQKGTIEFEIPEPKIILDSESNVIDIVSRERGISERLIENFMVAANESVATAIFKKELPFLYRNHGLGVNNKLTDLQKTDPTFIRKTLAQIDEQIKDKNEKDVINVILLRYMDKALYELDNRGHFGLGSQCYTHFTSPIRRYSDLIVHRLEHNVKFINKACDIINDTEKQAVSCEREVNKVCMAEFMSSKVGQKFDGIVSAVLKFGVFVQLSNCVEGLVHISTLPDYTYDEKMGTLTNKQNHFFKIETYEAGIVLFGSEIKSIRNKDVSINEAFVLIRRGEAEVLNMNILKYEFTNSFVVDPKRNRKLLLHKNEINKILKRLKLENLTLVPTRLYIKNNLAKLEIGLAKGKNVVDKRETIKKRDEERKIGKIKL